MTRGLKISAIVLWVYAPLVLALSVWHPTELHRRRGPDFQPQVEGFELVREIPITPHYVRLLGTDDAVWRVYQDASGAKVYVTCVFHENNWKSLHPPHMCIRGSNMDIQQDEAVKVKIGDREVDMGRAMAVNLSTDHRYLSYYAFVGRDFVTHSYVGFFWEHAPRALLRDTTPGFLIRVETYVGRDGVHAADERCLRFLRVALPHGEKLIR
jgi:EpsI family protein